MDDNSPLVSRRAYVDMNVIGIVPLEIAILTGDAGQMHQGLSFSDSQWDNPREDGLFFHSPDVPILRGRGNGWSALTTLIDAEGNVQEVCIGTGKKNDLDYYLTRPRVSGDYHGQAPVLWLATLLLP